MKCYWCDKEAGGIEFNHEGNEILICNACVLEALLAALKLNKFGSGAFPDLEEEK